MTVSRTVRYLCSSWASCCCGESSVAG